MSIKISIYEFFAFTIPGIAYLFLLGYSMVAFEKVTLDFQMLNDVSLMLYLVFVLVAYVIGLLIDAIVKKTWYRLFKPIDKLKDKWIYRLNPRFKFPETADLMYRDFAESLEGKIPKFLSSDWYGLLARLHDDNPETASSLERFNASQIMMRNISFALVVFSFTQIALLIQASATKIHFVLLLLSLVLSIVAGVESSKFHCWFYSGIYKASAAYSLKMSKLVKNDDKRKKKLNKNPNEH